MSDTITKVQLPSMELFALEMEELYTEAYKIGVNGITVAKYNLSMKYLDKQDIQVVKYGPRKYAPASVRELQLRTPNYYRGVETDGVGDPFEGCRARHVVGQDSWMEIKTTSTEEIVATYDMSGAERIDLCRKVCMYCTSKYDRNLMSKEKAAKEFGELEYDTASIFVSAKALALQMGRSYAATLARNTIEPSIEQISEEIQASNSKGIELGKFCVIHGSVKYKDSIPQDHESIERYFEKPTAYANQKEYRFLLMWNMMPEQEDELRITLPLGTQECEIWGLE